MSLKKRPAKRRVIDPSLEGIPSSHARQIKNQFFSDEDIAVMSPLARLAFIGIWTISDKNGVFRWKTKTLKSQVLPFDDVDFEALLREMLTLHFIEKYTLDGREYGRTRTWKKHQYINPREKDSRFEYPSPQMSASAGTCTHEPARATSVQEPCETPGMGTGSGTGTGTGTGPCSGPHEFDVVVDAGLDSRSPNTKPAGKSDDGIFHEYQAAYARVLRREDSLISRSTEQHRKEAADLYRLLGKEETMAAWEQFLKNIPTRPTSSYLEADHPDNNSRKNHWYHDTEERTWVLHDFVLHCGLRAADV